MKHFIDLTIVQAPTKVTYTCPKCEEEVEVPYKEFSNDQAVDYPGDWIKTHCPECHEELYINNFTYD